MTNSLFKEYIHKMELTEPQMEAIFNIHDILFENAPGNVPFKEEKPAPKTAYDINFTPGRKDEAPKESPFLDNNKLMNVLEKNEGFRDYAYVNKKIKTDVPTIGLGTTFRDALAKEKITLTHESGKKMTKTGSEWHNYFTELGYDKLPNGFLKSQGSTPEIWKCDASILKNFAQNKVRLYEGRAKRIATQNGIDYADLGASMKAFLIDSAWNGSINSATKCVKYALANNLGIDSDKVRNLYAKYEVARTNKEWTRDNALRRVEHVCEEFL